MPAKFHNPYTFIPRLPRDEVLEDPDLGDLGASATGTADDPARRGLGHDRLLPNRWSGTLRLRIRTETPLLICDAQRARPVEGAASIDHQAYPVRVDADGRPYLPATTLKGAISTAYEIITNSRYRIIDEALWNSRLGYRPAPDSAKNLKPVRIVGNAQDGFRAQILEAARVRMYPTPNNKTWKDFENGAHVWIRLDKDKVLEMVRATEPKPPGMYEGWLLRTGRTMDTKKHERVFYIPGTCNEAAISEDVADEYRHLLVNYHSIHQEELAAGLQGPSAAQHAEWGYHIKKLQTLEEGHLCWAKVSSGRGGSAVVDRLFPVMISRALYEKAPIDVVPENLRPAQSHEEMSPAERLFGWTNPSGHGAVRGRIRIGRARCLRDDAIEEFMPSGFPLNVLGQPKPQQERFYAASDRFGTPLKGADRGTGYKDNTGLRGYKFYVHHRGLPENYWINPTEDRTNRCVKGWAQEYRRPGVDPNKERDSQNRSILSWVKPGTEFEVDVHLTNVTDFELGALLWLFWMNDAGDSQADNTRKRYLRIGGGKPLGFGSVSVEVDWDSGACWLMSGDAWSEYWIYLASPGPQKNLARNAASEMRRNFENRMRTAFKLDEHPERDFLKAFLRACEGFRPVHYPRVGPASEKSQGVPQNPLGENFEWFVANERKGNRYSLPSPNSDDGLPYLQP